MSDQPTQGSREGQEDQSQRYRKPRCAGAWSFLCWLLSPWYCSTDVNRWTSTLPTQGQTRHCWLRTSQPECYRSKHQKTAVSSSVFSQTILFFSVLWPGYWSHILNSIRAFKTQICVSARGHSWYCRLKTLMTEQMFRKLCTLADGDWQRIRISGVWLPWVYACHKVCFLLEDE